MSEEIRPAIYDPEHYLEDAQKEIKRLKGIIANKDEYIKDKKAELERSKDAIQQLYTINEHLIEFRKADKQLISELADALDGWTKGKHGPTAERERKLSKRAREADK